MKLILLSISFPKSLVWHTRFRICHWFGAFFGRLRTHNLIWHVFLRVGATSVLWSSKCEELVIRLKSFSCCWFWIKSGILARNETLKRVMLVFGGVACLERALKFYWIVEIVNWTLLLYRWCLLKYAFFQVCVRWVWVVQSEILSYLDLINLTVFVLPWRAKVALTRLRCVPFYDRDAISWSHA